MCSLDTGIVDDVENDAATVFSSNLQGTDKDEAFTSSYSGLEIHSTKSPSNHDSPEKRRGEELQAESCGISSSYSSLEDEGNVENQEKQFSDEVISVFSSSSDEIENSLKGKHSCCGNCTVKSCSCEKLNNVKVLRSKGNDGLQQCPSMTVLETCTSRTNDLAKKKISEEIPDTEQTHLNFTTGSFYSRDSNQKDYGSTNEHKNIKSDRSSSKSSVISCPNEKDSKFSSSSSSLAEFICLNNKSKNTVENSQDSQDSDIMCTGQETVKPKFDREKSIAELESFLLALKKEKKVKNKNLEREEKEEKVRSRNEKVSRGSKLVNHIGGSVGGCLNKILRKQPENHNSCSREESRKAYPNTGVIIRQDSKSVGDVSTQQQKGNELKRRVISVKKVQIKEKSSDNLKCDLSEKVSLGNNNDKPSNNKSFIMTRRRQLMLESPDNNSDCQIIEVTVGQGNQTKHVKTHKLSDEQNKILMDGDWLNDIHINLAQALLKEKFPDCLGLENCGLGSKSHQAFSSLCKRSTKFVQIYNYDGNHWITISNYLCKDPNQVHIYDSYFRSLKRDLKKVLANLYGSQGVLKVVWPAYQEQNDASDCGLFAIAAACSILHGDDPSQLSYQQSAMRSHLKNCFKDGVMRPFKLSKTGCKQLRHKTVSLTLSQ